MNERVTLATSRMQLRPWRPTDVSDVAVYADDPEYSRYLPGLPYPYRIEDAEQYVAQCVAANWETNPRFAIVIDGAACGGVELRIDLDNGVAEVGYAIGRSHWGKGFITEAAGTVIAWAFRTHGIAKVWATADSRNVGSWRVMEKLGMQREAYLRSHRVNRGERVDIVQYGLLRREWRPGEGAGGALS